MKQKTIVSLVLAFITFELVLAEADTRRMVGLVELPSVFGKAEPDGPPGLVPPAQVQPVPLHSHPSIKSPVVAQILGPEAIETEEFDYEAPAAIVYETAGGWVLVRMVESSKYTFGWISPEARGLFHPVADLLRSGLCYLTNDWEGVLYADTDTLKVTTRIKTNQQTRDINILQTKNLRDQLWLEVELLGPGRCEGNDPKVVARGWVPVHKRDGKRNVWFFSRGC